MKYALRDLLDVVKLQELLESLGGLYTVPSSIADIDGNIITSTGKEKICTRFHRSHPDLRKRCADSHRDICALLKQNPVPVAYRCPMGLVDSAAPIIVEGEHVGNVFAGELLLEPPDEEKFSEQAWRHGIDVTEYIKSLRSLPHFSEQYILQKLSFISNLTGMLIDQGLKNKRLQRNDERHQTILTAALDGICRIDGRGRFIEVNHALCRMSGYSAEELLRLTVRDLEAQFTDAELEASARRVMAQGHDRFETRHRRKDGQILDVEVSAQFRPTDGGEVICFIRDITDRKREESALKESEERWKFALQGAGDGLWDWNGESRRVYFSSQWKNMLGYADHEVGDSFNEWYVRLHPDDKSRVYRELKRHLDGETRTFVSEHRILCKDGSYKWVLNRGKVVKRREDGKPLRLIGTQADITDRRRAELFRTLGQDILRAMNEKEGHKEATQTVIGLLKSATGVDALGIRLQEGNDFPYFCHEGFTPEFLQKENALVARNPDGAPCRDEVGAVSVECTCGLVLAGKGDSSSPLWTANGSFWTNDSAALLELNGGEDPRVNPRNECIHHGFASIALIPVRAKGSIVGVLQLNSQRKGCFSLQDIESLEAIADNIGEAMLRKKAEEKLIASERFLRMLTDLLPGMVGYWTDDLHCTFANHAYLDWFGKTPEQMSGITMQELMGEELFRKNEGYVRRALAGEAQRFERTLIKPNGQVGHTWAHYIPDMVDGKARGFFVLVSDVTELKRAEEEKVKLETQLLQAQKMESVGRLAGGVAHDFNNLLTAIIGYANLGLIELDTTHPIYTYFQEICKAAERSAGLTQQLLAFARKQTVAPKVLDLNETVENMLKMLRRLLGEDIHLAWAPKNNLWQIRIDPTQIDQIMANLCVNARDAISDVGKITIETANCTLDEEYCKDHFGMIPGDYVMLAVSDNGCGMDREIMRHVFEPFFTTKEVGQGTGLGLATVYGITKQNNGFINLYSEVGHGTTFKIYLPRHQGDDAQARLDGAAKPLSRGKETILLVEDEPTILAMTRTLLEKQGYQVLATNSPGEAIRMVQEYDDRIDLLITDVIMPEMNGKTLSNALLPLRPGMKCLFMSGYTANAIAHHGVLEEDVHFISKPFSLPELAAKVRQVLDGA